MGSGILLGVSLLLPFALWCSLGMSVSADGMASSAGVLLVAAGAGMLARHWRLSAGLGDGLLILSLMWLVALSGGVLALIGLRLHAALADHLLLAADRGLGFDHLRFVDWVSRRPPLIGTFSAAYNLTNTLLAISVLTTAAIGRRREAWRACFCFAGALLTVCLIAAALPARGVGVWTPPELLDRLPPGAMRYFWTAFDRFYAEADPVLSLQAIDGVVSFPSFHMIMGLIILSLWRWNPITMGVSLAWFVPMVGATIPLGGHYASDLLAGAAVWGGWYGLARRVERGSFRTIEPEASSN